MLPLNGGSATTQVTAAHGTQKLNGNGEGNTGREITIGDAEALKNINFRMLCATELPKRRRIIIPRRIRMELIQIKVIFTRLVESNPQINDQTLSNKAGEFDESQEKVPTEAFQRAFERLFFLLEDPEGFNAK